MENFKELPEEAQETIINVINEQVAVIQDELGTKDLSDISDGAEHVDWVREGVSNCVHKVADTALDVLSFIPEFQGEVVEITFSPFSDELPEVNRRDPRDVYQELADTCHEKIDDFFETDLAQQYSPEAKERGSEELLVGLPPPPGVGNPKATRGAKKLAEMLKKDRMGAKPIPKTSASSVATKVAKNAKATVEIAKNVGIATKTAAAATGVAVLESQLRPVQPQPPAVQTHESPAQAAENSVTVYQSVDIVAQEVGYVGITNNIGRRQNEHLRERGINIDPIDGLENLSRADARAVEQTLIEIHGLEKNGGTLSNRIHSIAETNPKYAEALLRGSEILKNIESNEAE